MADDPKPWTIRAVPIEDRNAAVAAAKRDGMDLGPWIGRAIRQKIQADRQSDRAPAVVRPDAPPVRLDLGELERMVRLAEQMHAMTGRTPRTIAGPISRLLRVGLRGLVSQTEGGGGSD